MKLSTPQISKIYNKINLANKKIIVMIDVSEDITMSPDESNFNIYCIDDQDNIIWQIKEIKTKPIDDADMFVYLKQNEKNEIIATRFSGFIYKINPETGEAVQIGFHK